MINNLWAIKIDFKMLGSLRYFQSFIIFVMYKLNMFGLSLCLKGSGLHNYGQYDNHSYYY